MVLCLVTLTDLQTHRAGLSASADLLFTLRMLVKHFCSSGNTLTLCALDISKAIDRVDVYGLLNALMTRRFPKTFVCIMFNWLQKCVGTVRCGN